MNNITLNGIEITVYREGRVFNLKTGKEIKFHISNGYKRCSIGNKTEYLHRIISGSA